MHAARHDFALVFAVCTAMCGVCGFAAPAPNSPTDADVRLAHYFRAATAELAAQNLAGMSSLSEWRARLPELRRQHAEMLGLDPMPERTDLKPVVTGRIEREDFAVEKLHFQSSPGLYVTANLYLPKNVTNRAPAILYVCGHGPVITNGVSYGNKVSYQHHGIWFARHGYVCLLIDTVQFGEILGHHHGTYREGQWWWNSRGYTPAGVEAWDGIRALDYLCTRPEVDTNRFGVTGRSGGGAYSWTLASLDDRVKVVAPVAGITDLQNHVVDGAVEGHCDCMFFVNTYRWDYPRQAALVAPRPLLLVNTDSDTIFPLDGVQRTHAVLRHLYRLYNASNNLGLVIGPGPHKDTQDLQVPVFRWFNHHLKRDDSLIERAATKLFAPEQLKVFAAIPADAINTNIEALFVRAAPPPRVPAARGEWESMRDAWMSGLRTKCFMGWPAEPGALQLRRVLAADDNGVRYGGFEFQSESNVVLRFYLAGQGSATPRRIRLRVTSGAALGGILATNPDAAPLVEARAALGSPSSAAFDGGTILAAFLPRGLGRDAWSGDARKQTQIRRRFMLLGQTLDGMRVWDIRRAVQAIRSIEGIESTPIELEAEDAMAVNALLAVQFESNLSQLDLHALPVSMREGPDYLNALKVLDLPQAVAMAAERCPTRVHSRDRAAWEYPQAVARALAWTADRLVIDTAPSDRR